MILQPLCRLFVVKIVKEWIVAGLLVSHAARVREPLRYMRVGRATRRVNIEQGDSCTQA